MSNTLEYIKALVSPTEKLIEVTSGAIGKLYEPTHIKRLADSKVYEIEVISQAMRDSSDIPIVYDKGNLLLHTTDFDEFVKRTQHRMAFQELTKQKNIENTVGQAYKLLEDKEKVPNDPIDADWLLRFFNSVQDISNVDMQYYWAKILADEVVCPGTVSLRTLLKFSQMSSSEAKLLARIGKYVLHCKNNPDTLPDDYFIIENKQLLDMIGISYSEIALLNEMGILSITPYVTVGCDIEPHTAEYIKHYGNPIIKCKNNSDKQVKVRASAFVFTYVGRELLNSLHPANDNSLMEYFDQCREFLGTTNTGDIVTIELYKSSNL